MKKSFLVFISFSLFAIMAFSGFECASTDITSAKLYIQQKNYDKAIDALQKEIAKNPKSEEGFYLMGYLYGEREEYSKMVTAFNNGLSVGKKYEKEIKQTKKSYWGNCFNKGAQLFNKANTIKGDSSKIFYEKSAATFQQAIEIEPDSVDAYRNLSYVYLNMTRYQDAIVPLKKIASLRKDKETYKLLGQIYADNGAKSKEAKDTVAANANFEAAIKYLEEGRKAFPDDQEILTELSNAYITANKADIAMETFRVLVEKNPENHSFRYNYGVLLLGSNNFPEAETQFLAALDAKPDYANATYNLAVTYVKWGAELQKKAEAESKNDPVAIEKYNLAIPQLIAFVDNNQNDAAVWELLGKVYSVINKKDDAKAAFDKADKIRSGK